MSRIQKRLTRRKIDRRASISVARRKNDHPREILRLKRYRRASGARRSFDWNLYLPGWLLELDIISRSCLLALWFLNQRTIFRRELFRCLINFARRKVSKFNYTQRNSSNLIPSIRTVFELPGFPNNRGSSVSALHALTRVYYMSTLRFSVFLRSLGDWLINYSLNPWV